MANNNNLNGTPFNGYPPLPYPSTGGTAATPYPPAGAAVPAQPLYGWNSAAATSTWGSGAAHGGNGPPTMSFAKPPGAGHFAVSSNPVMPPTPAMPGSGFGISSSTHVHGGNGGPVMPAMPPGYGSNVALPSAPQMPPAMSVSIGGGGGHFGHTGAFPAVPGNFGGPAVAPAHTNYAHSMSFVKPGAGGNYGHQQQPTSESFVKPGAGGHFGGVAAPAYPPSGFGAAGQISCVHCTFLNSSHRVVCEVCERPLR